ncbi:methylmalonyl-CoA mutase family protein [Streptomyces sp. NPDC002701]|uniref:methylmalonyl-CoA mutase family protein n=1 Tax=Streptomyces sp. NPDC002701 TaxID=3364661 RepID=UPI00368B785D
MLRGSPSGLAVESNARYRRQIAHGTTGLSVTFDLPTRRGDDSDAPTASGEVGRAGVAVDSLDDMRVLFGGIPLGTVTTALTVNAPAAPLLLMYQLVGEEQGVPADRLTGSVQSDVLEEYLARGTHIFPPGPSARLTADLFRYCRAELPNWDPLCVSGRRLAEAGASPAQEIAFVLADGIAYVRTAVAAGIGVDDFAPRLSFSFGARAGGTEEVATFQAARRIWARVLRTEFGAADPESQALRLHTRTARTRAAVRRPGADPVRVGGRGAAPRIRRMRAGAQDTTAVADPFAGSDEVEWLTAGIEASALELMAEVEELGGAVSAIGHGFQKDRIERSACRVPQGADVGERVLVGVGRGRPDAEGPGEPPRMDPATEPRQAERIAKVRAWRCHERVGAALSGMRTAAAGTGNVLYPMKDALAAGATVGEVCDALREVWGARIPHAGF